MSVVIFEAINKSNKLPVIFGHYWRGTLSNIVRAHKNKLTYEQTQTYFTKLLVSFVCGLDHSGKMLAFNGKA